MYFDVLADLVDGGATLEDEGVDDDDNGKVVDCLFLDAIMTLYSRK